MALVIIMEYVLRAIHHLFLLSDRKSLSESRREKESIHWLTWHKWNYMWHGVEKVDLYL